MNIAMFGGGETTFQSLPQDGEQFIAAFGGLKLDLSQLQLPESLRLSALAFAGGVEFVVPTGTDVVLNGFSFMGGRNVELAEERTTTHRSVLYLEAVAVMGGITVREVGATENVYEAPLA